MLGEEHGLGEMGQTLGLLHRALGQVTCNSAHQTTRRQPCTLTSESQLFYLLLLSRSFASLVSSAVNLASLGVPVPSTDTLAIPMGMGSEALHISPLLLLPRTLSA